MRNVEKDLNAIRFIAADGVQAANSGHTGMAMGAAPLAYSLFMHHMRHNPANPKWSNRDRFVLSGGHGSMLLYTMLYLSGYDLPLEDLKRFRQKGSKATGHPEWGLTPGVDTTTGPLGQGFANGVGMAIAEANLAATFNRDGFKPVDHYTYGIVTDGDLMEGISSEAASLAGHLKLGKLIYLYDDNQISIEGSTGITFTEDRAMRFEAFGWHVQKVADGNDVEAIDRAIEMAKLDPRPSIIFCRTIIGYGLPNKAGTSGIHGSPAGVDELKLAKENAGWPVEPTFYCPDEVLSYFRNSLDQGKQAEAQWQAEFARYGAQYPELAKEFERRMNGDLPVDWQKALPVFEADAKGMASRMASGKVINALSLALPELMGGSADLAPSNNSWMKDVPAFSAEEPAGRNIHFGVREISMAAEANGMLVHGGLIPYCATFLVFSDYLRGSMRVSALSDMGTIYVLTHDSIGVGEDGPTHQPIEHVMSLRLMPKLLVLRPGDANEVVEAWKLALEQRHRATALVLSRQDMPTLDRSKLAPASGVAKGAYVLYESCPGCQPEMILMATGTELSLALKVAEALAQKHAKVRVVSFPSWELFEEQSAEYREAVLPEAVSKRISIEAGTTIGWHKWLGFRGLAIGVDGYGLSAPAGQVYEHFGLTYEKVLARAEDLLKA